MTEILQIFQNACEKAEFECTVYFDKEMPNLSTQDGGIYINPLILERISKIALESFIYHEIGHLKLVHVRAMKKRAITNYIVGTCMTFLTVTEVRFIALGILYLAFELVSYWKMRHEIEYEADKFAVSMVGQEQYIDSLREYSSKKSVTHPCIEKRIKRIENQV